MPKRPRETHADDSPLRPQKRLYDDSSVKISDAHLDPFDPSDTDPGDDDLPEHGASPPTAHV